MYVCLNDLVDTLKLHFYPIEEKEKMVFNAFVDYMILAKTEAMEIKKQDNQERYIIKEVNNIKLRIMATSQSGFNVVCQTGDFTLSFRKMGEHKNPVIKAEFRAEFLLRNGYKRAIEIVLDYAKTFLKSFNIKVSEIHLAKDIQNYNFSILDFYRLKSLKRNREIYNQETNLYFNGLKFSGFSIGKGAEMLRIYNKTLEIDRNKNKAFVKYLSWQSNKDYDLNKEVWRIEFQLRREKLKEFCTSYGIIDNLESLLKSISSIWEYLTNKFLMVDFSIKQCQEIQCGYKIKNDSIEILNQEAIKKRFQRANISPLWQFIKEFKGNIVETLQKIKDVKKPAVLYVENAFKSLFSTFIKLKRGSFDKSELIEILLNSEKKELLTKGISIIDKARLKCIDFVSRGQDFFNHTGVAEIDFEDYKKDLKNNLNNCFLIFEDNPSNLLTFKEFKKRIA